MKEIFVMPVAAMSVVFLLLWGNYFWKRRLYAIGLLVGLCGAGIAGILICALMQ